MLLNDNPVMQDKNTSVSYFPWESEDGSVNSFDLNSSQVMTDPTLDMVDEMDTRTESNVEVENSTPEGADEGQTGDQGGDADGQNFGQDQGSQDTMSAEGMTTGTKFGIGVAIATLGLFGMMYVLESN
tara:strand:- start:4 stop:387 length:384 start_codon:yes stop_codon:yes gene_type:complete